MIASLFASTCVFSRSYMRNRDYSRWITRHHSANRSPQEDRLENGRPNVLFRLLDWLLKKKYAPLSAVPSRSSAQCTSPGIYRTDSMTSKDMSEHRFGLICNRVGTCPKTRADLCRLKCAERIMDATCVGPSQCGSHLGLPPPCAPEPPCIPPCRQCAPACLQPCRPCPPCPPPCRPCLPCPPNISQPACSDYSHTTTESYPTSCAQIPCRWDNTSYFNEGNDPTGNTVRQWNTSCHFANRQSGGSCSQPVVQCHCTLNVPCQPCLPCQPCSMPAVQEPTRGVIECQIPFRCRREVIITLPKDRCSPDRAGPTIIEQTSTSGTTPTVDIVTPTSLLTSPPGTSTGTPAGTSRRPKGKAGGRKGSKGTARTPVRKPSTGKKGRSPKGKKKSPGKKSPGKKSPKKGGRKKSPTGRKGSAAKRMSQAKQIIFSCHAQADPRDYTVLSAAMDTSLFSNRSSQLRWMENRRRLCTLNRRNQASNRSSTDLYRGEIDWKAEPEFEQTDTTSSYLRKKQGQERAARHMKKCMGPTSHA